MIRNPFCTDIENIIKDNVSLMSRYVSAENTIIEDMLQNICNIYFNNDTDMLYDFVYKYLQNQGYEKYNYKDKMIEIIKYIISYHIKEELNEHKILSKLSFTDINKCYDFYIKYEDDYYSRKSDPSIYFIVNKPEVISILNIIGNYKCILNESGNIINKDNNESVKDYIIKGKEFNYIDELTRYMKEMPELISKLTEVINNNVNKILKK